MSKNILVIHQGAVGDVILSFPALRCLKQEKNASVALLCKDQVGRIACELSVARTHLPIESACFAALFSRDMNAAAKEFISLFDTVVLISFSDDMEDQIRKNNGGQTYRITPRPPAEEETHVAIHIMKQMQEKGVLTDSKDIAFHANCPVRFSPSNVCTSHIRHHALQTSKWTSIHGVPIVKHTESAQNENLLLIHPGAGSQRKRWAVDNFIALAGVMRHMNGAKVVFLLGPAESDLQHFVKKRMEGAFQIHQIEDLSEVMAFLKAARCFIGNDSGLAHLAAIMGVPTVTIFGPSSPKRWAPLGNAVRVLRGAADCAPCFETEKANCDEPQCLSGVSVDMVLDAAKELT
jgi:ADP-heptose:LPS heptosyltransferase